MCVYVCVCVCVAGQWEKTTKEAEILYWSDYVLLPEPLKSKTRFSSLNSPTDLDEKFVLFDS